MKTDKAKIQVIIDGDVANKALKDLESASRSLWAQLRKTEDPAQRSKMAEQYRVIKKEIGNIKGEINGVDSAWKQMLNSSKSIMTGVFGGNLLTSGIQKLFTAIPQLIEKNSALASSLANVRKTTGLTSDEVNKLYKDLKKFDTPTKNSVLLQYASEAGKLGHDSVEDIKKFVDQADKITVALGEDLGEGAITDIGKLSNIFGNEMINIASAINEVGAASEASESWQVDFLKRMSGTAPTVKLAAEEVLGYGAALEAMGQTQEVSGTALNTFFLDFVRNTNEFGKVVGFARGELKQLLEEKGTNDAFLAFLDKLKSGSESSEEMLIKLKELGVDGSRGANVLLTLANNTQRVREQQLIANNAIQNGNSILKECEIRNNNLAGAWEKLKIRMESVWTNSSMKDFLENIIVWLADTRTEAQQLADSFKSQKERSESLDRALGPLVERYEELKAKGKLNKDEQVEIRDIMNKISELVPTAVTAWDSYGNAIEINTGKVKDFSESQRILAQRLNAKAIRETTSEIVFQEKAIQSLVGQLNTGGDYKFLDTKSERQTFVKYTDEQIKALIERLKEYREAQKAAIIERASLMGDDISKYSSGKIEPKKTVDTKITGGNELTEEEIKERERKAKQKSDQIKRDYEKLQEEILKIEQEAIINKLPIDQQELERVNQKYAALKERAKGHLKELDELDRLHHQEIDLVNIEQDKKEILGLIDDTYNEERTKLEEQREQEIITEEEYNVQAEEIELTHLMNIKSMKEFFGEETISIDKKIADQQIKLQKTVTDSVFKNAEKQKKIKQAQLAAEAEITSAQLELAEFGASTLKNVFANNKSAFIAFLALEKAAAISRVIVDLNREIASYYAFYAPLGPPGIVAASGFATAAKIRAGISIGAIGIQTISDVVGSGAKFEYGGISVGPDHASGGIAMIDTVTGNKVGEMEGGEPYMILSGNTYRNNKPIIDALLDSSMNKNGAPIMPNFGAMQSGAYFMRTGGVVSNTGPVSYSDKNKNDSGFTRAEIKIDSLNNSIDVLSDTIQYMVENGIEAKMSYQTLKDEVRKAREIRRKSSSGVFGKPDGTAVKFIVYLKDDIL